MSNQKHVDRKDSKTLDYYISVVVKCIYNYVEYSTHS